jgi:hypothetical protein
MKSAIKRLEELEKNRPTHHEPGPVFMWYGWEMTKKKEARILFKYPNVFFWKLLSLTLPYGTTKREGIIEHAEGGMLIWPDPEAKKKRDEKIRRMVMKRNSMRENE